MFSYEDLGLVALVRRFAAARFNADRVNAVGVAAYAEYGPAELLARVREHLQPSGLTARFGGQIALTDGLIHHQASAAHSPCPATSHSTACRRRCGSHPEHHPSAPPNASADYDSPRPTWTGPPVTAPSLKVRAKHY